MPNEDDLSQLIVRDLAALMQDPNVVAVDLLLHENHRQQNNNNSRSTIHTQNSQGSLLPSSTAPSQDYPHHPNDLRSHTEGLPSSVNSTLLSTPTSNRHLRDPDQPPELQPQHLVTTADLEMEANEASMSSVSSRRLTPPPVHDRSEQLLLFTTPPPPETTRRSSHPDSDVVDDLDEEEGGTDSTNNKNSGRLRAVDALTSSLRRMRKRRTPAAEVVAASAPPRLRSSLYRSKSERPDHLRQLYVRRRLMHRLFRSMDKPGTLPGLFRQTSSTADMDLMLQLEEEMDAGRLQALEEELQLINSSNALSERIRQINLLMEEFYKPMKNYIQYLQFPLEVRLENVSYTVAVDPDQAKIMTVFNSSLLYPIYKFGRRIWRGEKRQRTLMQPKKVLDQIHLVLQPGRQYLVLGPPGSGKTTLLRTIAALIRPGGKGQPPSQEQEEEQQQQQQQQPEHRRRRHHRRMSSYAWCSALQGTITYNGKTLENAGEFHIENAIGYIDQLDKHAPRLTVQETFDFAFKCKSAGTIFPDKYLLTTDEERAAVEKADQEHLATRVTLESLGLTEVKDTFVGDENVRGVSGGQRRRVTVGEMLMSRAPVLCGDEVSTGLDAKSTYDMIEIILYFARSRRLTRVFALLQPSPETVALFDEVIVLSQGQIIYCGPIDEVQDYFAKIGFICPEFVDIADFLQMVSTEDGATLYDPSDEVRESQPTAPTIPQLADMFRQSDLGLQIQEKLQAPFPYVWSKGECSDHGGTVSAFAMSNQVKRKYANNFFRSSYLILRRFFVLWTRDKRVIIASAAKNILMGISVGGVFSSTTDVFSILGALFQAGLFIMLGAMQTSLGLVADRVIFYKQADANFYSAWPFVFGRTLSQIPQTLMDVIMFGTILYYMVGLAGRVEPGNFFTYLVILFLFAVMMNQQMAVFASFATESGVQVYGACVLLFMMLFGGFIVPPDAIPRYYDFIYWWNPFAWAYRGLVVNEFRSAQWEGQSDDILTSTGFVTPSGEPFSQAWVGYSIIYMTLYFLLCCVLTALGLTFVRHGGKSPSATVESEGHHEETVDIPFQPVTLSFHDVSYEVVASTSKQKLLLLNNVNGIFRPGRMCALMGSSGAGKTTLLDVLSLRKRSGTITGEVLLNGWPQDPVTFRRCSGYVEQFGIQTPELTVRETLMFSAKLRLDPDRIGSDDEVKAFVNHIMSETELTPLAKGLVGSDEEGGLTFEQRKRLSIAVELAASPAIIFLDEPTSGLDARSALLVMKTLRRIADSGRTVVATIHQPSSTIFSMFDDLLLLKKGGHVVYHGEIGPSCSTLISYFESRGGEEINLGENPANWMLRVVTSEASCDLDEVYLNSEEFGELGRELNALKSNPDVTQKLHYDTEFAVPAHKRRHLVNARLEMIYWRSPSYNLARVMVSLAIAIVLGSIFVFSYGKDVFTETQVRARLSVVFLSFIITGIMSIVSVLPVMTKIRDLYYRHRDAGMYDSVSLGIALGVAEKYFIVFSTALFTIVFLGLSSISYSKQGYFGFWGFFTFNFAIYSYFGQAFVCMVKSQATAFVLTSVFIGLNNFFSGLIVRPQFLVGGFFAVPYYITPGHYVYEGLVVALFQNDQRTVIADEGSEYYYNLVQQGTCVDGAPVCQGTVENYVNLFFGEEFSENNVPRNALILGFVLTLVRFLTWVALKYARFS